MGNKNLPSRCFSHDGQFCEMEATPYGAMQETVFKSNRFSQTTVGLLYKGSLALFKCSEANTSFLNQVQCFPGHCLFSEALQKVCNEMQIPLKPAWFRISL